MRTCVGCRAPRPQSDLVRIVRSAEGDAVVGRTLPGRGAWLCAGSTSCLDAAMQRGGLARALRGPLTEGSIQQVRTGFLRSAPAVRD